MDTDLEKSYLLNLKTVLKDMTKIEIIKEGSFAEEKGYLKSFGVTSVLNFTGKMRGRFVIDVEDKLAIEMARRLTGVGYITAKSSMVLATISEFNNIVSGTVVTQVNNSQSMGLWLSIPFVLSAKNAVVCTPSIESSTAICETAFGKVRINIAIERLVK